MLTLIHVVLALSAIAVSVYSNARPSADKLRTSYGLAASTLASGVLLIFVNNASVLRTCMTGVIFFAVVSALNELARRKLTAQVDQI